MADWTYNFLPAETEAQFPSKGDFQYRLKKQSRILAACRDVANASKNLSLTASHDAGVETVDLQYVDADYALDYVGTEWHISIDGVLLSLDDFGRGLISFWQNYLESLGLLPE